MEKGQLHVSVGVDSFLITGISCAIDHMMHEMAQQKTIIGGAVAVNSKIKTKTRIAIIKVHNKVHNIFYFYYL